MEYERYYSSFLLILSEVKFVLILEKDSFSFIIEFFDNTLLKFSKVIANSFLISSKASTCCLVFNNFFLISLFSIINFS